jgi:hypothetical protein
LGVRGDRQSLLPRWANRWGPSNVR